jgi:type 1 glutamine amidotransferase
MAILRRFVAEGKPVIGIRTASHAFSLRGQEMPEGTVAWPEWDAEVFGGNYTNHYGNQFAATVRIAPGAEEHAILTQAPREPFRQGGSLYKTSPLKAGAAVLLLGQVEGQAEEPVAWTFERADGGRSFYTSLGHVDDFANPAFVRLLLNGVHWAAGLPMRDDVSIASISREYEIHWRLMPVPAAWEEASAGVLKDYDGPGWYRCAVRLPQTWLADNPLTFTLRPEDDSATAWFNGRKLEPQKTSGNAALSFTIPADAVVADEANLIVVRLDDRGGDGGLRQTPVLTAGESQLALSGRWQFRLGEGDESWTNMPLPAKFGASTDVIFQP